MESKETLRQKALEYYNVNSFPQPIPLNMKVIWKRKFRDYEEWKIEYDVETAETMPVDTGRRVPAYLLIPRGDHKQPLPAMVCFHQCALNCAIGKEAVVGKAPWSYEATDWDFPAPHVRMATDRTDQAYGHDLVHQRFVVLAPDSICCGERHIPEIRQEGDNCDGCFKHLKKHLGREGDDKHIFDNLRAVDVLDALEFVDSERIGAIGHSMGSSDVFKSMVVDPRIKVGIMSGDGRGNTEAKFLPLISPRLYIGIQGAFDGPPHMLPKVQEMHADARPFYEADGAGENLILLTPKMGHFFGDKVKWAAYKHLKAYFGVLPPRTRIDLSKIVSEAREASRWMPEEEQGGTFPEPKMQKNCFVSANKKEMISALAGLFLHISDMDSEVELRVSIKEEQDLYVIDCRVSIDRNDNSEFEGASYQTLREVERILSEHDTTLQQFHSDNELQYQISFPKSSV